LWPLLLLAVPSLALSQRPSVGRAALEAEVRREFARVVQQQVGLTDPQMRQLSAVTRQFAAERRRLQMDERATRGALQRMLRDSTAPDSAAVEGALRRLLDAHKRRAQLVESEHAELAKFMSPVQRAKYLALQEQLRRRLEQRRMRRDPGTPRR
jgi:hypothetical protein